MRNRLITYLLAPAMMTCLCGCTLPVDETTIKTELPPEVSERADYDKDTNYMALMIQCGALGDMDALTDALERRNAKIVGENMDAEILSVDAFLKDFEEYAGFSAERNYAQEMIDCCVAGDIEAGRAAEKARNLKIDAIESTEVPVSFDDMYLLSKIITSEAGCSWLSMDWKMAVGEVLVNRAASPEFPDTLQECVYQPGQYAGVNGSKFQNLIPFEDCALAAFRLLSGERVLNEPAAVFQSSIRQGSGVCIRLYDEYLGTTYICYSSYPELYQ